MPRRKNHVLLAGTILIFTLPAAFAALPSSTNTDAMWVSENATDFWVMNNPDSGLKNEPSVFHYNSELNLVERFSVKEVTNGVPSYAYTKDLARLNSSRWAVIHRSEVLVYDEGWNHLRSRELSKEGSAVSFLEQDDLDVVVARIDRDYPSSTADDYATRYYSYDLDPQTLELENETSVEPIGPNQYPPETDEWVQFEGELIENRTVQYGPNVNFTRYAPLYADDGQIEGQQVWFLGGPGGNIYNFTLDMANTGENYSVGLNQSQIRPRQGISSMFLAVVLYGGVLLVGALILLAGIYIILSSDSEGTESG